MSLLGLGEFPPPLVLQRRDCSFMVPVFVLNDLLEVSNFLLPLANLNISIMKIFCRQHTSYLTLQTKCLLYGGKFVVLVLRGERGVSRV